MSEISGRLENAEDSICHPLLLVGIFAELERTRQISLVIKGLEGLLKTVSSLSRHGTEWEDIAGDGDDAIDPWLLIHYLKNGLENWKEQLKKMVAHVEELSDIADPDFGQATDDNNDPVKAAENAYRDKIRKTGKRIGERLAEIVCNYDEKIRECTMIMDGMTLATQLVS